MTAQVAHIADEEPPAGSEQAAGHGDHLLKIGFVGKVHRHGVHHDGVEVTQWQVTGLVGLLHTQVDLAIQVRSRFQAMRAVGDHVGGQVGAPVFLAGRRDVLKDQAVTHADFQQAPRLQFQDALAGLGLPFTHFFSWQGFAAIAAVPAPELVLFAVIHRFYIQALVQGVPTGNYIFVGLRRPGMLASDDIADQALEAVAIASRDHHGVLDALLRHQGGGDFAWFHAKATHLHLLVRASGDFHYAAMIPAGNIARPIHALAVGAERAGDKSFGGQSSSIKIAASQACSSDVELAGHSWWRQTKIFVQDVDACVGDGASDGYMAPGCVRLGEYVIHRAGNRRLGGTIVVDQSRGRYAVLEYGRGRCTECFAARGQYLGEETDAITRDTREQVAQVAGRAVEKTCAPGILDVIQQQVHRARIPGKLDRGAGP